MVFSGGRLVIGCGSLFRAGRSCFLGARRGVHPLVELTEDHFAGGSLQDAGDGNVDGLRDHLLGVIHHHHRAVIQVGHSLVVLLAFLEDEDPHGFARQYDRLQRIRQLVDIEHLDAVELGYLIQVEIVGDDLTVVNLGQFDQLHIDFPHVRKVLFDDLHVEVCHFLNALQDVEPAASAVALHGVGRIGHQLQFAQDELRDHQHAVEKAGLGDIGDAPVDDDAGIQDFERLLRRFFAPENTPQRRQVQHVTLLGPDDQAHVGHQQQQANLQKRLRSGLAENQGHEKRAGDSQDRAHRSPDQTLQADLFQPHLEENDDQTQKQAAGGSLRLRRLERTKFEGGKRENENENNANKNQIEHGNTPFRVRTRAIFQSICT